MGEDLFYSGLEVGVFAGDVGDAGEITVRGH